MSGGRGGARAANDIATDLAETLGPVVKREVRVAVEDIALDAQSAVLLAGKSVRAPVGLLHEELLVLKAYALGIATMHDVEGLSQDDFSEPACALIWSLLEGGATLAEVAKVLRGTRRDGEALVAHLSDPTQMLLDLDVRQVVLELIAASRWRKFVNEVLVLNAELSARGQVGERHAMAGARARLVALAADVGPALRAVER